MQFMTADPYQPGSGNDFDYGGRLVGRVMAEEYNLAVQRGDDFRALNVFGRMIGYAWQRLFSR